MSKEKVAGEKVEVLDGFYYLIPKIEGVIYHDPSTTINWVNGTQTTVTCLKSDKFNKDVGFMAAVVRKVFGEHNAYKQIIKQAYVVDMNLALELRAERKLDQAIKVTQRLKKEKDNA